MKIIAFFIFVVFVGSWLFFSGSESSIRCFIISLVASFCFGLGVIIGWRSKDEKEEV